MTLTEDHTRVLDTVGPSGGTWSRLRGMVRLLDLFFLEAAGYLWRERCESMQIWHLTERGAAVAGINPARIYRP